MSGDNLHGNQPIKFHSEVLTVTKIILIERHFNFKYSKEGKIDHDQKYIELQNLLTN